MARRKSRPLLNQEVAVSLLSSQEYRETASFSSFSAYADSQQPLTSSQTSITASEPLKSMENVTDHSSSVTQLTSGLPHGPRNNSNIGNKNKEGMCQTFKVDSTGGMRPREPADLFKSLSQTFPVKQRPGYFANRRSASFMIHDDHDHPAGSSKTLSLSAGSGDSDSNAACAPKQPLRRTTSLVKLSMDSEGKAEVMPRTGSTPSPPKPRSVLFAQSTPRPSSGMQRSLSAIKSGANTSSLELFPSSFRQRKAAGKSRDVRMWEFYCDSDARNALNEQAEREERGSAAAAIGLIRSHSQSSKTLTTNNNKRNAHVQKYDSVKRHKADGEKLSKPKLGRATSSVARLQTTDANLQKQKTTKPAGKHRKSNSQSAIFEDFEGDSDKENWEPGTQTRRPPRHRPVTSQESARILLESLREPSQSSSIRTVPSWGGPKARDQENGELYVDDEVAAFMGETALPREEDDLDCVQNLLSLSQAAWE